MLSFSAKRGRGGSALTGLMDNGRSFETSGLAPKKFHIETPYGIVPISVDNFFLSHRIDQNDSILES